MEKRELDKKKTTCPTGEYFVGGEEANTSNHRTEQHYIY